MKFKTVVVDPPWPMERGFNGWGRRRALPYASMSIDEIRALDVRSIVANEGYVFLWATAGHLGNAFDVLRVWGLSYRQPIAWCKEECVRGLGGLFGSATEYVLVAQRINPGTHAHGKRTLGRRSDRNWFTWPRHGHSEKPDEFYGLVEGLLPGPRLDLFARRRRVGWMSVGDAVDGRDVRDALQELAR